jgi:hypothetical protein
MNKLKKIIDVIGLIVKYSAIVMALIRGLQFIHGELMNIDTTDEKKLNDDTK